MSIYKYLNTLVSKYYINRDWSHGQNHVNSVKKLCTIISKNMHITDKHSLLIINSAALFHDVWDNKYIKNSNDIYTLKNKLRNDLKLLNLNNSDIDDIYTIIDNISFTKELNNRLNGKLIHLGKLSLYRNIVSDADKIESLGKKGIERIFIYEYNLDKTKTIPEYINITKNIYNNRFKILINYDYIKTSIGKHLAKPLIQEMEYIINNQNLLYSIAFKLCKPTKKRKRE